MSLLPVGIGNAGGEYTLENSLRFRKGAPGYLSRTFQSVGNRTTWTWSAWVKRSLFPDTTALWSSNVTSDMLYMSYNGNITFYEGTAARPVAPDARRISHSTVGFPRESRISRLWMSAILLTVIS
jgi:hypothetical protein